MANCIFKTFISATIIKCLRHTGNTSYAFSLFPLLLIPSTLSLLPFSLLQMTQNLYDSHVKRPCTQPRFAIYSLPSFLHGEEFSSLLRLTLYQLSIGIKYLKPAKITSTEGCDVFSNLYLRLQSPLDTLRQHPSKERVFEVLFVNRICLQSFQILLQHCKNLFS